MKENGCYIIKDSFFERFNDPYLKGNKDGNRPHYFCVKDYTYENLFWVIPLSSRGVKFGITQPDVLKIKAELIKDIEQSKRK